MILNDLPIATPWLIDSHGDDKNDFDLEGKDSVTRYMIIGFMSVGIFLVVCQAVAFAVFCWRSRRV